MGSAQRRKPRFPPHWKPAPVVTRRGVIPAPQRTPPERSQRFLSPFPDNASRFLWISACDSASTARSARHPRPLPPGPSMPPEPARQGRRGCPGAGRCQPASPARPGRLRPRQGGSAPRMPPPPAGREGLSPGRLSGNGGSEHRRIPAIRASQLTRARSLHGARRFVVKPGMPTALLTPQHNRAAVSTGAPCQLFTLARPNRCPSALPASPRDNNSCCHRQPWCHKHPPTPINPWLLVRPPCPLLSAPTAQCRVPQYSSNPSQLPQVTRVWQHRQNKVHAAELFLPFVQC